MTADEYEQLPVKAFIVTKFGMGDDYLENAPKLYYHTYQCNKYSDSYYQSLTEVMPITLEEMALNAGRFARFNTDLRENVAVSEACPDAGSSAQDWSHIDRFETRVQWCADNVAESDTWSLFIIEQHSEFHFAFAFSSVETALLFRLGVI